MLESLEDRDYQALRQRLAAAGSVFDFKLYRMLGHTALGEETHRQVLAGLFDEIATELRKHRAKVIAEHPEYASYEWPELVVDLPAARPVKLGHDKVVELTEAGGPLEQAFLVPPYSTTLKAADFRDWLSTLGLLADEEVEVFDWVGNPDEEPERSNWSNYFDAGKEWWGIWCMTVYNARRGTVCALAASTSD